MEVAMANNLATASNRTTMVATSANEDNNNNNQQPQQQHRDLKHIGLDHGLSNGLRSPFQREIREWQRIDPSTGALVTGRLEADRWINGPLNSYGKISDSQNIAQRDGTRLSQRKQLEVLQQRTASGAMQVIRAQTVQSSSSRWSSSTMSSHSSPSITRRTTALVNGDRNSVKSNNGKNTNNNKHNSTSKNDTNKKSTNKNMSPNNNLLYTNSQQFPRRAKDNNNSNDNRLQPLLAADATATSSSDDDITADGTTISNHVVIVNAANTLENDLINDYRNCATPEQARFGATTTVHNNNFRENNSTTSHNKNQKIRTINSNLKNFLLLNTEPSLKLSNLMKSSSHISNNNNCALTTKTATTTTTTTNNTIMATAASTTATTTSASASHLPAVRPAFKLKNNNNNKNKITNDPHEAVGNSANNIVTAILSTSNSSTATVTINTMRPQQQQQQSQQQPEPHPKHTPTTSHLYDTQPPTFNPLNSSFTKSRVGGIASKYLENSNNHDSHDYDDDVDDNAGDATEVGGRRIGFFSTTDQRNTLQLTPTRLQQRRQQQQQQQLPQRRDLESFRHYEFHNNDDDDGDDDDQTNKKHYRDDSHDGVANVRVASAGSSSAGATASIFSAAHQDNSPPSAAYTLQRARSISTDDLSTEWNDPNSDNIALTDESSEWRRVSKLRRSFQSAATAKTKTNNEISSQKQQSPRRPLDLPESSVSVAKIRDELENGRRLNTAMRNNHVDLTALQRILDTPLAPRPAALPARRTTFLTAESLKEIRAKLKRLSDESLYKDDFMTQHLLSSSPATQFEEENDEAATHNQLSSENKRELSEIRSAFAVVAPHKSASFFSKREEIVAEGSNNTTTTTTTTPITQPPHTTHSLESRQKCRDNNSAEWHLRRKSYGFEKMSPPSGNAMFRMDASTDSGLGRSGELATWSPTETMPVARGTVIHFGESARLVPARSRQDQINSRTQDLRSEEAQKRHSIAVDESQYVRQTSQVHINALDADHSPLDLLYEYNQQLLPARRETTSPHLNVPANSSSHFTQRSQQKRVEFCKTEVHFAAESGRVNIVETDGKPPPTNNFRRRRRTTCGPLQSLVIRSASPVASPEKMLTGKSNGTLPITYPFGHHHQSASTPTAGIITAGSYRSSLLETPLRQNCATPELLEPAGGTLSMARVQKQGSLLEQARSSYTSTSGLDTATDCETDDISSIRGILKNKLIKPKPYHLGENIENSDALWGLQQRPTGTTSLSNNIKEEKIDSFPNNDLPSGIALNQSVAEGIRNKEQQPSSTITACFSTKINLNLDDTTADWKLKGDDHQTHPAPKPVSAKKLMLDQLKENQKIIDEGLKSTSLIMRTMRSANEFDEAMRRLSIVSSSEANAAITPAAIEPYHQSFQKSSLNLTTEQPERISPRISKGYSLKAPFIVPRLKLIRRDSANLVSKPTHNPQMHHLSAPLTNETANETAADSADEEVKHYFRHERPENSDSGGGTQESSSLEEEFSTERPPRAYSYRKFQQAVSARESHSLQNLSVHRKELPKSNVMSIKLHSPQQLPVTEPRLLPLDQHYHMKSRDDTKDKKKPLRIIKEARGARKLREHELSYFGVQPPKGTDQPTLKASTSKRTLPHRQRYREEISKSPMAENEKNEKLSINSNLSHNRIDLLPHYSPGLDMPSPDRQSLSRDDPDKFLTNSKSFSSDKMVQYSDEEDGDKNGEHFYENITNEISSVIKVQPPDDTDSARDTKAYSHKSDFERDERSLSEMTHNADQTMRILIDEANRNDQRRRSLSRRRNSKPLETIDEKCNSDRNNDPSIGNKLSRSTVASEAKRHNKLSGRTRTLSQSSGEGCSRPPTRSLSSDRESARMKGENVASRSPTARPTKNIPYPKSVSPTSSLESGRSSQAHCSSTDDERVYRRDERLPALKTKRPPTNNSSSIRAYAQDKKRHVKYNERKERDLQEHHQRCCVHSAATLQKEKSTSTTRSSQRERDECATDIPTNSPQRSSSSRRYQSDPDRCTTSSRVSTREQHDIQSGSALKRSSIDRDIAQRSSRKSERSRTETKRLFPSKGHSIENSHYISQHPQQHQKICPSSLNASDVTKKVSSASSKHKKTSTGTVAVAADILQTHSKNAHLSNGPTASTRRHNDRHKQQQRQHRQQLPDTHERAHQTLSVAAPKTTTTTASTRKQHL